MFFKYVLGGEEGIGYELGEIHAQNNLLAGAEAIMDLMPVGLHEASYPKQAVWSPWLSSALGSGHADQGTHVVLQAHIRLETLRNTLEGAVCQSRASPGGSPWLACSACEQAEADHLCG